MAKQITAHRENAWADFDPKKRMFAYYYLEDYNHRKAAERVGFPPQKGLAISREPLVAALIADLQEQMQLRTTINSDFVRTKWLEILPKLMGEEEVAMVDKEGCQFAAKKFHSADATRALVELGKSTKFYADGSGGSAAVNISINLQALGIEEKSVGVTIEGELGDE
jgi:hypothetical protein